MQARTTTILGKRRFSYEAPVKEPIVQNLISEMELLSEKTEIIKLEKAVNKAFTTVPARINLVEVIFPPCEAIMTTKNVAIMAPKNEPIDVKESKPKDIVSVAPNVAPEETPRIYGSAIGLLTVDCITAPHKARPAPAITPKRTLGTRIFQTMLMVDFFKSEYISGFWKIFPITTRYVSVKDIETAPKEIANKNDRISKATKTIRK